MQMVQWIQVVREVRTVADTRVFRLSGEMTAEMVFTATERFLKDSENMTTQSGRFFAENIIKTFKEKTPEYCKVQKCYIIQGKKKGGIWKWLSRDEQVITVHIFDAGESINVTVGFGKWSDETEEPSAGTFIYTPTGVIGRTQVYMQRKIPSNILNFIDKFILCEEYDI